MEVENSQFKKSVYVKILAIAQLVAFVVHLVFIKSQPVISSYIIWVGGSIYSLGILMTIASIMILSSKKEGVYKKGKTILFFCYILQTIFLLLAIMIFSQWEW